MQEAYLTQCEVERLMDWTRKHGRYGHRDATMILVAFRHGLRASEVCDLQWQQIELSEGRLRLLEGLTSSTRRAGAQDPRPDVAVERTGPSRRTKTKMDSPRDKSCDHARGRHFLVLRSRGPTAVSASSISRFLGLGAGAVAAAGSIVPSITLIEPLACASSDVFRYSIMASSSSSDRLLITLLCSTLCSRGTSSARIFKYAAGCVRRTRSIAFGPPCRKSRSRAAINSPFNCWR